MLSATSLVLFSLFYTSSGQDGYLPPYIKPCNFGDANFAKCVKEQIEVSLPHFTKGIPEFGVPALDPLKLDDIKIDGGGLNLKFTEASLHGVSQSDLTNLKVDIGKSDEAFVLSFKGNLSLIAKYTVDGRILLLPIQGQGDARVKATNIEVQIDGKLSHTKDTKGAHFKLTSPSYKYTIQNTKFELDNLFNGNKQLASATLQFANENWQQLMDDLAPPVVKQIVRTAVKAINKFFSHVTQKQIVHGFND